MGDLQRFWGEMDALRDARQDRARVLVLEAETARLRDRLARMTTIARERGDDLAFAHAHAPAWHAIKDERDRLRAQVTADPEEGACDRPCTGCGKPEDECLERTPIRRVLPLLPDAPTPARPRPCG